MFSIQQKREISEAVQKILRATDHPELPPRGDEIEFHLHVTGRDGAWSWADILNNGAVPTPHTTEHNESQDPRNQPEPEEEDEPLEDKKEGFLSRIRK